MEKDPLRVPSKTEQSETIVVLSWVVAGAENNFQFHQVQEYYVLQEGGICCSKDKRGRSKRNKRKILSRRLRKMADCRKI